MDRKRLISRLRQYVRKGEETTRFCPDDLEISGFVDGTLSDSTRNHIEHHLPDCQACINRVGLLTRLLRGQSADDPDRTAEVPARNRARAAPKWAAAASVFITIGYLAGSSSFIANAPPESGFRATRTLGSEASASEFISPSAAFDRERDALVIRWTEVPGSLFYEVRVVSDVGNFVGAKRMTDTEWAIDEELGLEPDREYFVRVDAFLTDAKPVSSPFVAVTIRE